MLFNHFLIYLVEEMRIQNNFWNMFINYWTNLVKIHCTFLLPFLNPHLPLHCCSLPLWTPINHMLKLFPLPSFSSYLSLTNHPRRGPTSLSRGFLVICHFDLCFHPKLLKQNYPLNSEVTERALSVIPWRPTFFFFSCFWMKLICWHFFILGIQKIWIRNKQK